MSAAPIATAASPLRWRMPRPGKTACFVTHRVTPYAPSSRGNTIPPNHFAQNVSGGMPDHASARCVTPRPRGSDERILISQLSNDSIQGLARLASIPLESFVMSFCYFHASSISLIGRICLECLTVRIETTFSSAR